MLSSFLETSIISRMHTLPVIGSLRRWRQHSWPLMSRKTGTIADEKPTHCD
jgi:hypothetical protein